MRVEQTERGLVVVNEGSLLIKLFVVILGFTGLLNLGIFAGSFVLPAHTATMTCSRETHACLLPGPHGVKLPLEELGHFVVSRVHGKKNSSEGFRLFALMNGGTRVALSESIYQSDHRKVLEVASDELNRFVEDGGLAETSVTYVERDTDRVMMAFLGVFSLLTGAVLSRLWRRRRTEVDRAARTVHVKTAGAISRNVEETIPFADIVKVHAFSGGQRGWASVSLELKTGRRVELAVVPRYASTRKQLATLLPALGSTLGVEVMKNEGYRAAWDAT